MLCPAPVHGHGYVYTWVHTKFRGQQHYNKQNSQSSNFKGFRKLPVAFYKIISSIGWEVMDNLDKKSFESILSMDCPLVRGLSPVRPRSVHTQVCIYFCICIDILDTCLKRMRIQMFWTPVRKKNAYPDVLDTCSKKEYVSGCSGYMFEKWIGIRLFWIPVRKKNTYRPYYICHELPSLEYGKWIL
jgi:hypothetical protein